MISTFNFLYQKFRTIWHYLFQPVRYWTITITYNIFLLFADCCRYTFLLIYYLLIIYTIFFFYLKFIPISLLNLIPCNSILFEKPSAIASASIPVAEPFQFKKHVCSVAIMPLFLARSHTTQYLFLIPIKSIFLVLKPIIVA